jgi:hypothetical protein
MSSLHLMVLGGLTVLGLGVKKAVELILDKEYATWAPALARILVRAAGFVCRRRREHWRADLQYLQQVVGESGLLQAGSCLLSSPWLALRDALAALQLLQPYQEAESAAVSGPSHTSVSDTILEYSGFRWPCECHLRIYERPGRRPLAIVGQMEHSDGSITNSIETLAAVIATTYFAGNPDFECIEYHASGLVDDHYFSEVTFRTRHPARGRRFNRVLRRSRSTDPFAEPSWRSLHRTELEERLGQPVDVFQKGTYTKENVLRFRDEGRRPFTMPWDPWGLKEHASLVAALDRQILAARDILDERNGGEVPSDCIDLVRWIKTLEHTAGTVAMASRFKQREYDKQARVQPDDAPVRMVPPVLGDEEWKVLDYYEEQPLSISDHRRHLLALREGIARRKAASVVAATDGEAGTLERAEEALHFHTRMCDPEFRAHDHPAIRGH